MLADSLITVIVPVINVQRARDFYENKLGLKSGGLKADENFVYECRNGALVALFPQEGGTKADHTAISFQVQEITQAVSELKRAGGVFEDYDFPGLKTVDHVCVLGAEKAAWFADTQGNYLCVHEDLA